MEIRDTKKFTIHICILLTIIFEVVLAALVYKANNDQGVMFAAFRLVIQLIFLLWILFANTRFPVYVITFYHVIVGLQFFADGFQLISLLFGLYHCIIGLMIYFNEEVDLKLKKMLS